MNKVGLVFLSTILLATACRTKTADTQNPPADSVVSHGVEQKALLSPPWAKNATIYEVNVRQFSAEGDLKSVEKQLPRLKELGVDVLWLMPIFPISQIEKKGKLGSPYAVADYRSVNPDYGTFADLKALVNRAHVLGMHVILDWVANHTGRDHVWVRQHPDWYVQVNGKMQTPKDPNTGKPTNWTDVYALDFTKTAMRQAMKDAMSYWVKEGGVDGFRCDVAGFVPNDFWAELRTDLDRIKPVFMLAEWEDAPEHFKSCFNANYSWSLFTIMKGIAQHKLPVSSLDSVRTINQKRYPPWAYQMYFTQNHDENAHNGTLTETFGEAADVMFVLCSTLDGMPLIYNGMESGLDRRLAFFDKDSISWGNYERTAFYEPLLTLKHRNRALWNGLEGGKVVRIATDQDKSIYAFYRQCETDRVVVVANLSDRNETFRLLGDGYENVYTDVFSHTSVSIKPNMVMTLKPWEYRVLTN